MKTPSNIVPPAPRGPIRMRKSGAGKHAQGVRRQRSRSDARRASLREAGT